VEYRFKRLHKRDKEAIIRAGKLHFDGKSGEIRLKHTGIAGRTTKDYSPS
jgi:hypothetical protein